jgi:hypothetical protein
MKVNVGILKDGLLAWERNHGVKASEAIIREKTHDPFNVPCAR